MCLHLFVGSGVIEAGCKTVIGSRLKQSGMFWTVRGANAIVALRCCRSTGNSKITGRAAGPPDSTLMSRTPHCVSPEAPLEAVVQKSATTFRRGV
jgi:hypothetical protein